MYRDAYMSDVVVTLKATYLDDLETALNQLRSSGLQIASTEDNGAVVEGVIDNSKLHAMEQLDCVQYIRRVHTYAVDFPAGDPRDRNEGISGAGYLEDDRRYPRRALGKTYP